MASALMDRDTELSGMRSFPERQVGSEADAYAGSPEEEGAIPSEPEAVAGLLQQLAQREAPVTEAEIARAAQLLATIIHSPQPAMMVATHLDEIDSLLPALIELNVRQAAADGQVQLASALNELRLNILLQKENVGLMAGDLPAAQARLAGPRVLFLNPEIQENNPRMALAAEALAALGCQVQVAEADAATASEKPSVVIVSNPHTDPDLMQRMALYAAMNVPIICDLDIDFEEMPSNHPLYERTGLGNLSNARTYMASLMLAKCVTVPSATMASELSLARCPIWVVPDGWSQSNSLWSKAYPRRSTINIGWVGAPGHVDDVAQIRRLVTRIVREFPQTQLVIAGDPNVYHLFESLPDPRKLFLPFTTVEDFPFMLSQMDIVIVPLRNIPFNRAQSDRILVEAGARQIPWVASPIPAFSAWAEGGLLADSEEQWYNRLRQLVVSENLRLSLAQQGYEKAQLRESHQVGHFWLNAIRDSLGRAGVVSSAGFQED